MKLRNRSFFQCIFQDRCTICGPRCIYEGLISLTPLHALALRELQMQKGVLLVSFSLRSTRGGLHHRFVTGMTESESHAGGRTCNRRAAGAAGVQRVGSV